MDCKDILKFLDEYVDNELTAQIKQEFEQHLHRCHNCFVFVSTYKKSVMLVSRVIEEPIPETINKRIETKIHLRVLTYDRPTILRLVDSKSKAIIKRDVEFSLKKI